MPGENDLGDLIFELKVSDEAARETIKEFVGYTQEQINKLVSAAGGGAIKLPADFGGAHFAENTKKLTIALNAEAAAHAAAAGAAAPHATALVKVSGAALSVTGQIKVINAHAQEAHQRFGVMANAVTGASTAMRILTGESGFAVIEMGRLTLYFGRAITAAGGVAAAVATAGAAIKAFWISIGPPGWIIAALGATYLAYQKIAGIGEESRKKEADALKAAEAAWKSSLEVLERAKIKHEQLSGAISGVVAVQKLAAVGAAPSAVFNLQQAAALEYNDAEHAKRVKADADNAKAFDDFSAKQKAQEDNRIREFTAIRQKAEEDVYNLREKLNEQSFEHAKKRIAQENDAKLKGLTAERTAMEDLAIRAKLFGPSAREGDPLLQRIMRFQETQEAQREALKAEAPGWGTAALGPRATEFRFGPGAMGSTIGVETEAKKTNKLLEDLIAVQKDATREFLKSQGFDFELYGPKAYE